MAQLNLVQHIHLSTPNLPEIKLFHSGENNCDLASFTQSQKQTKIVTPNQLTYTLPGHKLHTPLSFKIVTYLYIHALGSITTELGQKDRLKAEIASSRKHSFHT